MLDGRDDSRREEAVACAVSSLGFRSVGEPHGSTQSGNVAELTANEDAVSSSVERTVGWAALDRGVVAIVLNQLHDIDSCSDADAAVCND